MGHDPPHMGYPTSNPRPPILISVIFMVEMRVLIFFYVFFILHHIICAYLHILFIYIMFGMHKPRRFLLIIKLMLLFVPCRFGYQFISNFSSLFLFIYLFFVYLINYILLLLLLLYTYKYIYIYIYIYIYMCIFFYIKIMNVIKNIFFLRI